MDKDYYMLTNGRLRRKNNTVYFESETQNINEAVPVKKISNIYLMASIDMNTHFMNLVAGYEIPVHFFTYYGYYTGTFLPKDKTVSGKLLINQVNKFNILEKRSSIARQILIGSARNIMNVINYYRRKGCDLQTEMDTIESLIGEAEKRVFINDLMGIEANIRKIYYSCWNKWLAAGWEMNKRTKRPPQDKINTLVSFLNTMLYTTTLTQIYITQLNPTISYLHSPGERRYSLALDIADIFKPIIVDRLIFYIVNKNMLDDRHFDEEEGVCYLNDKGRRVILKEYDNKLKSTFYYKKMKKYISYKMLIRVECYKLIKHIMDIEEYISFRMEW